ncbi:MAG: hypothetical protein LBP22_02395 [Deltaproteobacteria bacterium]|nr:hypothetical protein [Deltaproteobacteria bacterium]
MNKNVHNPQGGRPARRPFSRPGRPPVHPPNRAGSITGPGRAVKIRPPPGLHMDFPGSPRYAPFLRASDEALQY